MTINLTTNRQYRVFWPSVYLEHPRAKKSSLKIVAGKSRLCRRAMSIFLDKSSTNDAYGRHLWDLQEVIISWDIIKRFDSIPSELGAGHNGFQAVIIEKLEEAWIKATSDMALEETEHGKHRAPFSNNIWSFCIAAGFPKDNRRNPFKSPKALRDLVSRRSLHRATLHTEISKLDKQITLQQSMNTALAYRNILGNLSATTSGRNATVKWHAFLKSMFRDVEGGKIPSENPFSALFDQHKFEKTNSIDHLKGMAKELYSTLSRMIHAFRPSKDFNQDISMPNQFDPMQIDFMAAMKPENLNNDGVPN